MKNILYLNKNIEKYTLSQQKEGPPRKKIEVSLGFKKEMFSLILSWLCLFLSISITPIQVEAHIILPLAQCRSLLTSPLASTSAFRQPAFCSIVRILFAKYPSGPFGHTSYPLEHGLGTSLSGPNPSFNTHLSLYSLSLSTSATWDVPLVFTQISALADSSTRNPLSLSSIALICSYLSDLNIHRETDPIFLASRGVLTPHTLSL